MLIDTMNEIKNKNKEIKIYSLPKLRPNKTLELGIKVPLRMLIKQ